ncbi:MAG: hypothetical protein F4X80_00675 [Chloroflexi bacterium]|nr:hypothetical protein [Chloroflexota bacterium]
MRAFALLGMAVALVVSAASDATATEHDADTVAVEVRVWQDVDDARIIHVGARWAGGSWRTLGMVPLALNDGVTRSGYRYGDIELGVALPEWEPPLPIEVRVWQHPRPEIVYVSARPAGGSWLTLGTVRLLLDDGVAPAGQRFGDIRFDVPLPTGDVTTFAGQPGVRGYADGPGSEAQFSRYYSSVGLGLDVDRDGSVVVADKYNRAIRRIAPDGTVTTIAGGNGLGVRDGPADTAQFAGPRDVAIAHDGSIYVADTDGHRIRKIAPDGFVSTVAGGGPYLGQRGVVGPRIMFADGPASEARFTSPIGIVIDDFGDLYVIEHLRRIRRISPSGWVSTFAGSSMAGQRDGPASSAQFFQLLAVAIDKQGALYVLETVQGPYSVSLRKVGPDGVVRTLRRDRSPGLGGTLARPVGLAVDDDGRIYIANMGRHQIVQVTDAGALVAVAGTGVPGYTNGALDRAQFNEPGAIALSDDGVLFVADEGNNVIRRIVLGDGGLGTPGLALAEPREIPRVEGVQSEVLTGQRGSGRADESRLADGPAGAALFHRPWGMALDAEGYVIVADSRNHAIRRVAPDGRVTTVAGGNGRGALDGPCDEAQFAEPQGVAVDDAGFIFVADFDGNRIRRISPDCIVTTMAGGGEVYGVHDINLGTHRDGPAMEARFRGPTDLVFDHEGNLLILEEGHSRIRKLSPHGIVSTIAGATPLPREGQSQWSRGSSDGPAHSALFYSPDGIAIDNTGNIFFTERGSAIRLLDPQGFVSTVLETPDFRYGGELSPSINGIVLGADGALYVADPHWGRVVRVTLDGMLSIVVDGLFGVTRVIALPDGALLVTDSSGNLILKITFEAEQ